MYTPQYEKVNVEVETVIIDAAEITKEEIEETI